jgi:hypothetical protein
MAARIACRVLRIQARLSEPCGLGCTGLQPTISSILRYTFE